MEDQDDRTMEDQAGQQKQDGDSSRPDEQADLVDVGQRYRVVVSAVSGERGLEYVARTPELPDCQCRAGSRGQAIAALEQCLADRLASMRADGLVPPPPVDGHAFDGRLSLRVSPDLHRELVFAARSADLELGALLAEIIARTAGRDDRDGDRDRGRGRPTGGGRGPGGRRRGGNMDDRRYHGIMENRADFIEYVRQLERDGGARGGSGPGRGRGGRGR